MLGKEKYPELECEFDEELNKRIKFFELTSQVPYGEAFL